MATMNFSIPEDVKREFQETFARDNKSAILTDLVREAIERRRRHQRRQWAVDRILELRRDSTPTTDAQIARMREEARREAGH